MVRVLSSGGNPNAFLNTQYFNQAHYGIYKFMTPDQRLQYQNNLKATNPMEYNKLIAQQKQEELRLLSKKVREVEKKIKEYSWYEGKSTPFSKRGREIESLYKVRGSLIKQGEQVAGYKGNTMSDAYVTFSNGETHLRNLENTLYGEDEVESLPSESNIVDKVISGVGNVISGNVVKSSSKRGES